jgi:hypothetical protein
MEDGYGLATVLTTKKALVAKLGLATPNNMILIELRSLCAKSAPLYIEGSSLFQKRLVSSKWTLPVGLGANDFDS